MNQSFQSEKQHLLERLDLFGIGINIRFNKMAEHKTKVGGIITLIILGILAYQIKIIIDNLYDTSNPTVLFEQKFTSLPERYNLTHELFTMTFGLQDSKSQHYIDNTIYKATLLFKQTEKIINQKTGQMEVVRQVNRVVKTEPCTEEHFKIEGAKQYFMGLTYQQMYCISLDETSLYIEGQFDSLKYSTLEIIIESCSGANCRADKNTMLNNGRLAVYYVDYSVIPSDKSNPFQPLGRQSFWVSGPEFTKQLRVNFRNTYLDSDYGMIQQKIHTDKTLTFSSDREQTTPKSGNVMYDCYISLEKNVNSVYKRSYQKVDKALSQLGGIFNLLFTLGAFFCKPLSQIELNLKLINRLFKFEQEENTQTNSKDQENNKDDKHKIDVKEDMFMKQNLTSPDYNAQGDTFQSNYKSKIKSLGVNMSRDELFRSKKAISQSALKTVNTKSSNMKESSLRLSKFDFSKTQSKEPTTNKNERDKQSNELKEFFNVSSKSTKSMVFKGWEYLTSFFKFSNVCRSKKQILLQKGVEKLYHQIDIFYMIQKMIEIEKLKRLLLNDNQIKLFEFIPKPVLSIQDKKLTHISEKVNLLYENDKDLIQKTSEAQLAFSIIMNSKEKPSKVDIRILEMLDPNFKQFLQMTEKGNNQQQGGDLSSQQRNIINALDLNKNILSTNQDEQQDEIGLESTQEKPYFLTTNIVTESPRKVISAIYSKQTKRNETSQINIINI